MRKIELHALIETASQQEAHKTVRNAANADNKVNALVSTPNGKMAARQRTGASELPQLHDFCIYLRRFSDSVRRQPE